MTERRTPNAPLRRAKRVDSDAPATPLLSRRVEIALACSLLACGIILRCGFPDRLGIDHFDEGVYASQTPPGPLGHSPYPLRHLYAPPLVPFLQHQALAATHDLPAAPNWAGVVAGLLTLVVLWLLARQWFGPIAGLCTLALAATSDVHAAFSRTALTDPWLLLWLILAVAFFERALRRRALFDLLAAAFFTGLAWWTKYNGWLPLAIGAAGWLTHAVAERLFPAVGRDAAARSATASSALAPLFGVALIAGILFYAQIYLLQADGHRYSEIAANHRKYVVGLVGWGPSCLRQAANLRWFDGPATLLLGPALIAALGVACLPRTPRNLFLIFAAACAVPVVATLGGSFPLLLAAAGAAVAWTLLTPEQTLARLPQGAWPVCLLAAWLLGLAVATPGYHPYARLTLPLLAAAWLGAGWLCSRVLAWIAEHSEQASLNGCRAAAILAGLACLATTAFAWPRFVATGVPAWQDRTTLRRSAEELFQEVYEQLQQEARASRPEAVFLTYGEPAAYYALSRLDSFQNFDELALIPAGGVPRETIDRPLLFVTGPHSLTDDDVLQAAQRPDSPRLELIGRKSFHPSDILLLDQADPRSLDRLRPAPMELRCYRVR